MAKTTTAAPVADPPAPKPRKIDSIHIAVVGNGFIVSVHGDDYEESRTVHIGAESALRLVTSALIPQPKPARKPTP